MKVHTIANKRVVLIPDVLTPTECAHYRHVIDKRFSKQQSGVQGVYLDAEVAWEAWQTLRTRLPPDLVANPFSDYVSYTRRNYTVAKHLDLVHSPGERYKLAIYLNTLPDDTGGTTFFTTKDAREPALIVPNKMGSVILFDLDLYHAGVKHHYKHIKYMIGFRLRDINALA